MARHKHADAIIAWAEGEEIQFMFEGTSIHEWIDFDLRLNSQPDFNTRGILWRIKPKTLKREGWVNVYKSGPIWAAALSHAFYTKKEADQDTVCDRVACIRIEWEEEA